MNPAPPVIRTRRGRRDADGPERLHARELGGLELVIVEVVGGPFSVDHVGLPSLNDMHNGIFARPADTEPFKKDQAYPFIILAILFEDGRPFFFTHKRETLGGREFPCLKFRSMRNDADQMKAVLRRQNEADGPQFFMKDDPRLTRVGRFLRKCQLDEDRQPRDDFAEQLVLRDPHAQVRRRGGVSAVVVLEDGG